MLKNRIKTLIDLIENTEIEEIEVSSFWGAQKIRLSKNKPSNAPVKISQDSALDDISVSKVDEDSKPLSKDLSTVVSVFSSLIFPEGCVEVSTSTVET